MADDNSIGGLLKAIAKELLEGAKAPNTTEAKYQSIVNREALLERINSAYPSSN